MSTSLLGNRRDAHLTLVFSNLSVQIQQAIKNTALFTKKNLKNIVEKKGLRYD